MSATGSIAIRPERPADHESVYRLNCEAFDTDLEARLVESLRSRDDPAVSLVAVLDKRIVGHALFTPVAVEQSPGEAVLMALGPMAVLPVHQRQGIGSKLVRAGLEACRAAGAAAVFVLGHAEYYPRFGFERASQHGLRFKDGALDSYFMVIELGAGALRQLSGEVRYLPEFDAT